jgi:hypothetical protein
MDRCWLAVGQALCFRLPTRVFNGAASSRSRLGLLKLKHIKGWEFSAEP